MSSHSGQQRPHYTLLVLLAMAILLDRYLVAGWFPWASELAGVNPIVVFLDIPVHLPVSIDLPVIGIFFFFYWILLLSYPSRYGASTWQELRKRLWSVFTGVLTILLCLAAGGGIYYLSNGLMSRQVRNGIDSFGIQADIYTPIPNHEIIHLRGAMILLVCFFIGVRICIRRMRKAGTMLEQGAAGRPGPGLSERSESLIDPRIAGFQEKASNLGVREDLGLTGRRVSGQERRSVEMGVGEFERERKSGGRQDGVGDKLREPYARKAVGMAGRKESGAREAVEMTGSRVSGKERRPGEREGAGLPDGGVMRPRTAATSVPVVAPLRVDSLSGVDLPD